MNFFIHEFNVIATSLAFFCFASAHIIMVLIVIYGQYLITEFARLRFTFAFLVMVLVLVFWGLKITMLAAYVDMLLFLVVLLICFWYTEPTFFTLVVLPRAPYVVHSKFRRFYFLFTYLA